MMLIFHCFFTFGMIFGFPFCRKAYLALESIAPPVISVLFLFACAYSCTLSRNNVKRGLLTWGAALALSAVTIWVLPLMGMENEGIYFGILHFLGTAMLLSPLLLRLVRKVPWQVGVPLNLVLAVGTRQLTAQGFFGIPVRDPFQGANILFPLGIYHGAFYSADYYPVFPWIFVFILGCYAALWLPKEKLPERCFRRFCPPVEFLGRHSLPVYLVHQPVIYGIGLLLRFAFSFVQ